MGVYRYTSIQVGTKTTCIPLDVYSVYRCKIYMYTVGNIMPPVKHDTGRWTGRWTARWNGRWRMEDDNYKTKIESTNILTMKCQQHTTYDFQYFICMPLFSTISWIRFGIDPIILSMTVVGKFNIHNLTRAENSSNVSLLMFVAIASLFKPSLLQLHAYIPWSVIVVDTYATGPLFWHIHIYADTSDTYLVLC